MSLPSAHRHAELVSASISPNEPWVHGARWTLKQVQGDVQWESEMNELPSTHDVEVKLLRYLASVVRPKSAQCAYDALAIQFGLRLSTRTQRMPNQGEPHWPNRVRTAMTQLVNKGYAERVLRDNWLATSKGRERIALIDSLDFDI